MTLLTRLRELNGPDREVDAEIALLLGWRRKNCGICAFTDKPDYIWAEPGEGFSYGSRPPHFTASVDAAQAAVPEGCQWSCGSCDEYGSPWGRVADGDAEFLGDAFNEATALTMAALQARGVK